MIRRIDTSSASTSSAFEVADKGKGVASRNGGAVFIRELIATGHEGQNASDDVAEDPSRLEACLHRRREGADYFSAAAQTVGVLYSYEWCQ